MISIMDSIGYHHLELIQSKSDIITIKHNCMNILRNDQIQSEVLNISEECGRQTDMMEASYAGMSRPSNIPWAVPIWLPPPPALLPNLWSVPNFYPPL